MKLEAQSKRRAGRLPGVVIALLAFIAWVSSCMVFDAVDKHWLGGPRPMFCERVMGTMSIRYSWRPRTPFQDQFGNLMYCDPELNLVVLIITREVRNDWPWWPISTHDEATLLEGTPFALRVERTENALIVAAPDGRLLRSRLPTGAARDWEYSDEFIQGTCTERARSLVSLVLEHYRGPDTADVRALLEPFAVPPATSRPPSGPA